MRRKGELSSTEISRRWPCQVALRELDDPRTRYDRNIALERWRTAAGEEASPRGFVIVHENSWWSVYCFASEETAARFMAEFGGRRFNIRAKRRGPGWQGKGDFL
jgi:hypothetical protein